MARCRATSESAALRTTVTARRSGPRQDADAPAMTADETMSSTAHGLMRVTVGGPMRASTLAVVILTCGACIAPVACGDSKEPTPPPAAGTPSPAPPVTLTPQEKQVWAKGP